MGQIFSSFFPPVLFVYEVSPDLLPTPGVQRIHPGKLRQLNECGGRNVIFYALKQLNVKYFLKSPQSLNEYALMYIQAV